ncbi:Nucleotide-binding universal stress protein, UspA family [Halogranum rubrum]|uniref:Nucleotide-binding universal stress protein, UspA family n=1 Tax=Halogranum rubrum TaxID=553466 RepID=A0A1I4GVV9_9EURY|nr:universal stress protein [Halogranum rubrum]SFL33497.1 Nucleotide-binding universal stress protein, UspA family [Halogranum rubrum]
MERVLAVVDPTEVAKNVVREAGEIAEGMDAEVVLIHVTTDEEYSARRRAMEALPKMNTSYTHDDAKKGATEFARDIGDEILTEFNVEYEAVGSLGNKATEILDTAAECDCDHIFLPGRQRSPTGKALFGDTTQRVILRFDGFVTVATS